MFRTQAILFGFAPLCLGTAIAHGETAHLSLAYDASFGVDYNPSSKLSQAGARHRPIGVGVGLDGAIRKSLIGQLRVNYSYDKSRSLADARAIYAGLCFYCPGASSGAEGSPSDGSGAGDFEPYFSAGLLYTNYYFRLTDQDGIAAAVDTASLGIAALGGTRYYLSPMPSTQGAGGSHAVFVSGELRADLGLLAIASSPIRSAYLRANLGVGLSL